MSKPKHHRIEKSERVGATFPKMKHRITRLYANSERKLFHSCKLRKKKEVLSAKKASNATPRLPFQSST